MNEELLQELTAQAKTSITQGLSGSEFETVESAFNTLLRKVLETTYSVPSPHNETFARQIGEALIQEVVAIAPQERLGYLANELFEKRVSAVSRAAWAVVEQYLADQNNNNLQSQAQNILDEVETLQAELESRYSPRQRSGYGRMLSEAFLDAHYVLGKTDKVSLRLGRTLHAIKNIPGYKAE